MIHIKKGDLLASDCTILAHQANCFSTMGAGIAKQIKGRYPEAYEADKKFKLPPRERLGRFSFALSEDKKCMIFNLYGQFRPGKAFDSEEQNKRYIYFESAFEHMLQAVQFAEEKGYPVKLGIPYKIGSALAGGDWEVIYEIIQRLSEKYNRDVYVYQL